MARTLLLIEQESIAPQSNLDLLLSLTVDLRCERVTWNSFAPDSLGRSTADLVVAVVGPPTAGATSLFEWLQGRSVAFPTFVVFPEAADDELVNRAAAVADDFAFSPLRKSELQHRVTRLLRPERSTIESVQHRLLEELGLAQLVGRDPAFSRVIEQLPAIARSDAPVLITGETGTGKELCARAIHHLSKRSNFPFIAVDCAAVPDQLFENELFGHTRGAFTDAHRDQAGLVAMAEGGTLFLDEVDALSLTAQAKLLRLLEQRTFRPLGSPRYNQANINILAATNRDLESGAREKQFRADLFFRLNVLRVHLPPLRDRRSDISLLARHFLKMLEKPPTALRKSFSPGALRNLEQYNWPGNIRELLNVVQRAVVLCEGTQILPAHVTVPAAALPASERGATFRQARAAFERTYVEELLCKHRGNITRAAFEADKERRAFGRLIKKHHITRPGP